MNVSPSKYVFRMKSSGLKARLAPVGLLQLYGVDYMDTYAPLVRNFKVRMLLAIVTSMELELDQMNVVTAFLYGDLGKDLYLEFPERLRDPKRPGLVFKFLKSLYGLKQAPSQRYARIHSFLVDELGLKSSHNDPCYIPCTHLPSLSSFFCMLVTYSLQVIGVHPLIA